MHQIDTAAPRGRDVEAALHESDPRMRGGDPEVTGYRQLGAATHRVAVERGNHRKRKPADLLERGFRIARHFPRAINGGYRTQFAKVSARREALIAGAAQNDDPQILIDDTRR